MSISTSWYMLPIDLIELQLGQIDLLLAMYPDEAILEESARIRMDKLRDMENQNPDAAFPNAPSILIALQIAVYPDASPARTLQLDLVFPFTYGGIKEPEDAPKAKVRILQPHWLSKAATNHLMADIPESEDLLGTIEHVKEAAARQLEQSSNASLGLNPRGSFRPSSMPLVRVWFYFPSISTRSKRDDFIIHAPSYSLTGFLYAGKPGLLCVEGGPQSIDDYMKFIKTESWADIPAHHKKVSERYRETKDVSRVFEGMTEITDTVGERRGQRANRGDMKAVEEWLTERGLGGAFAMVLM
ncbi:hypothetical protein EK21DRAFT_80345 [Setomelanomma holmii]|uniref:Small nuclear ribonucleoprotein Prp3 C-terminal domain-containing protein n=1 Tax=Setomelanomma holmii TaxID=210430 RepID=A0A9P4LGY6_9PLEO|nr:hypothetical protein EK21DRAFT_80345 [Setomelanomma holmii]